MDHDSQGQLAFGRAVQTSGEGGGAAGGGRGKVLADFANHPKAQMAELDEAEVAALRLYTTAAFVSINAPLRDLQRRERKEPHPLALTVLLIRDAVLKLRAVEAMSEAANQQFELYRGMRNVTVPEEFMAIGGTELAPMSTTSDINIALKYSASRSGKGVLLRLATNSSMERGADLTFLSAFPGEKEYLYPPLTYLQLVAGRKPKQMTLGGAVYTVVEVEPRS